MATTPSVQANTIMRPPEELALQPAGLDSCRMPSANRATMKQRLLELLPPRIYLELKRWDYKRTRRERFLDQQTRRQVVTEDGYSYKPFDDTGSIFVHIPKCAGVSMCRALFGGLAGGHTTLEEYLTIFEPKRIRNYFKFTVVRNPWDRVVSSYFFLKSGGFNEKDRLWSEKELAGFSSFDSFVRNWLNRTNIWKWAHFNPQYFYMLDKREKVHLDFVGLFENLESDFSHISRQLGLGRTLTRMNKGDHRSYMDYYDATTRRIVAEVYAEDINMLGYTFDNSSLNDQILSRNRGKVYSLRA